MAYVSQDLKKSLSPKIKAICKKYGVKATLAVRNHSTLVLNISEGKIDFIDNWNKTVGANSWYSRTFTPAKDYLSVNKGMDYRIMLNKKLRWFVSKHGKLNRKNLSGFKSFVIENTKLTLN